MESSERGRPRDGFARPDDIRSGDRWGAPWPGSRESELSDTSLSVWVYGRGHGQQALSTGIRSASAARRARKVSPRVKHLEV
jgi:hypothetical protein